MSEQQQGFWVDRFKRVPGIRAVGHHKRSAAHNQTEYEKAADLFLQLVGEDLPEVEQRVSVLDVGFGLGHYARLCKEAGFQSYVGVDFASPPLPDLGPSYREVRGDFGKPLDLDQKFDLVLAIDVLYHITDRAEFDVAIENLRKHARHRIYVTGLMEERKGHSHCYNRGLDDLSRLGELIDVQPWRDNKIARFRVQGS